jgi:hypothetical protein
MKPRFTGLAIAALLIVAAGHPGYAEDATASQNPADANRRSNRGAARERAASVADAESRRAGVTA